MAPLFVLLFVAMTFGFNETWFLIHAFVALSIVLVCFRLGKSWLMSYIAVSIVLMNIFVMKQVNVFGLEATLGNIMYASLFFATDLLSEHYGGAEEIHKNVYLVNHCPLLLISEEGKNLTPDKLSGRAARELLAICDQHLIDVVDALKAVRIIGIGKYAEKRASRAISGLEITSVWHPSPASPLANRNGGADWKANVLSALI